MHNTFRTFIENLSRSVDTQGLQHALSQVAAAFDLRCFAYLSLPDRRDAEPCLISTYPRAWTSHYLQNHYERLDPVVEHALSDPEPFEWGPDRGLAEASRAQRALFEEAAEFGIRYGFTIPIHDSRDRFAAITFAVDEPRPPFRRCVERKAQVFQLMALLFHAQVRRVMHGDRLVAGVRLSHRQMQCLEWAAQGKSASDIGCILGISPRTSAFHIENAKAKLGVRTVSQAVALLAASKSMMH